MIENVIFSSPYEAFLHAARAYPEKPFLHIPASARKGYIEVDDGECSSLTLTYREAAVAVDEWRYRYDRAGFGIDMRIALLLENRPECFIHFLALNSLGACVVPLNPDYRATEIAYVVEHSEAALVVSLTEHIGALRDALANMVSLFDVTTDEIPKATRRASATTPNPDTECALLYTSGTTGKPKGCILDNRYFLRLGTAYLTAGGLCEVRPGAERLITPLPMFHMNALACSTMAMLMSGGCIIQLDRFHPRSWWQDVASSEATIVHYLGVMPAILLGMEDAEFEANKARLKVRFGLGSNVDPSHHAAFEARFGFPLIEGWAMTETGGAGMLAASHEPRHVGTRCFGKARAEMELRLVNDRDEDVPEGTPGQIILRFRGDDPRSGFFRGYLKDPAATEAAWAGGWFHTGDLARRGPDGVLYFVDRQKNIIRRSGENIAALEVEACLLEHEAVRQIAVIAAPDALRDEEVMACIVLATDFAPSNSLAHTLQQWCLERLAYYKAPGYVAFVEALPTTSTNKVQKTQLAAFSRDPLNSPDCYDLRAFKKRTVTVR